MLRHLFVLMLMVPATSWADNIRILVPVQTDFRAMTEDMTAAFSLKPLNPTEPLGIIGFHVGGLASYTELENAGAWRRTTADRFSDLKLVGVSLGKGLPLGIDVGGFYAEVLDTNARLWGLELRYAVAEGGLLTPAVGVRASYTLAADIDDFDFDTYALDVSISKGFTLITPYAGFGRVWGNADPDATSTLSSEEVSNNKLFAGVRLNLVLLTLVLEADRTGDNISYNLRAGIGF